MNEVVNKIPVTTSLKMAHKRGTYPGTMSELQNWMLKLKIFYNLWCNDWKIENLEYTHIHIFTKINILKKIQMTKCYWYKVEKETGYKFVHAV